MMLTLRITFPWGRYYAHPWGQNPARITEAEWPPSPWRLLRAIAAAWFHANPGCEPSDALVQTLEVLGRELPTFVLPKVSFSRAIHYQPNYGATSKSDIALAKYKRVRHENHFACVGGDLLIQWQLTETDTATITTVRNLLDDVVGRIAYLGRAESVCEIHVEDDPIDDVSGVRVSMKDGKPCRQIDATCRDVFCPNPSDFQASDLWKRRSNNAANGAACKHLVQDLLDAPQPLPDGAAWYSYQMPEGWPEQWIVRHSRPPRCRKKRDQVIAHFLEFSLQCRIPVPAKHTVSIAEMFRAAAIRNHGQPSFALSGHDRPDELEGQHLHAFYLPQPDDTGQQLVKLQVQSIIGFTQQEVNALMSVGALRWAGGRFPARPILLQVAPRNIPTESGRVWQSRTPFVPPRYWYRKKIAEGRVRAADSPENQMQQNLLENGVDATIVSINRTQMADAEWDICKVHLPKSTRLNNSEPDRRVGVFLRIEFAEPVTLPLPGFGHSCHFGMGQLSPSRTESIVTHPQAAGGAGSGGS